MSAPRILDARSRSRDPLTFTTERPSIAEDEARTPTVRSVHTETELLDAVGSGTFDCLVLDRELDSGSGLAALETIRAERPHLPIVFCTESASGTAASEATRHDIDAYHIHEGEESLEKRVTAILSDTTGDQSEKRPIIADGSAATHGTPFVEITETINDAVVIIDADSYVRFANEALANLTGYDHEEIVGDQFTKLMPERFQKSHHEGISRYLETGERQVDWEYIELAVRHADGHEIPVAVSFAEFERDGETFFTGVIRDITDQKKQSRALKQLHEIASDPSLSSLEKIRRVLDDHRQRLGVSLAFLGQIDSESEDLVIVTGEHDEIEEGLRAPIEETYCQYAMETDEPLILPNVERDETIPDSIYERFGLSCYLGETVVVDGEPYGTICFADETKSQQKFDEGDVAFLEVLADWVGYELTQKRQRERLEAERERTEQILERVDDAFFAVDDEWAFTYFNTRAEEVLGRRRSEVLGERIWDVFPEAVDSPFRERYERAMETQEPVVFEEYYQPLEKWFQVSAYPSSDGLSVYFSDITDRKEYTEALAKMHDQTRDLVRARTVDEIADVVVDATREVIGQEFCGVRIRDGDRLRPASASEQAADIVGERPVYDADCWGPGDALERQEPVIIDQPMAEASTTESGPPLERVESFEELLFVPIGTYGTLGIGSAESSFSETDRSLAELLASHAAMALERAERESELRTNETVLETLQGMVYAIDTDGAFELVTEPLAEWLGYEQETLLDRGPDLMLDERDRERFWRTIEGLRRSEDDHSTVEIEMVTADGERRPAEIELSVTPPDSPFTGSIGVVHDRSELAKARQQLESERDRFRYLFDNLPDAVSEARFEDDEPIVESVNDSFETIFGYEKTEVIGRSLNEFILPEGTDTEATEIDQRAASGEYWSGEVRRRTASGLRYFLFRGVPYTDPSGVQRGFGIYTDITTRKQRERRLQVLTRVLRHNLRNELTVLLGYAELLQDELDDEQLLGAADSIRTGIDSVSKLSENARQIQKTLSEDHLAQAKSVREVVTHEINEFIDSPDAELELLIPPSLRARLDGRFQLAVHHLVENAVEHSGSSPTVRVQAYAKGDILVFEVADSGPGIPDLEWDVVVGNMEITQLSHGSGLGLWAAQWVVESYGGRIERFDTDLGGAGVRMRLPGIVDEE